MPERRVVDLEDRAAVVAEVAEQAEVDLDPVGGAARSELLDRLADPRRRPLDRLAAQGAGLSSTSRAAAKLGERHAGRALLVADPLDRRELRLEADQVVSREPFENRVARLPLDAELGQQLAIEVGVAEPDHGAVEPGRVERGLEHLDHLGGALRGRGADQLHPRLGEFPHLAALRAHGAVGVGEVAEADGLLGGGVSARRQPRDRNGHFRAQREQVARSRRRSDSRCRRRRPSPRASTSSYSIAGVATSP